MKVAIITELTYPLLFGGAEKRYWELIKNMNNEIVFQVFTMGKKGMPKKERIRNNITIHRISLFKELYKKSGERRITTSLRFALNVFKHILRSNCDLIDVNASPLIQVYFVKVAALLKSKPMIITIHEVWYNYWKAYFKGNSLLAQIGKLTEFFITHLSDKIITVSNQTKNQIINLLKVHPTKVIVIPNGIDFEKYQGEKTNKKKHKIVYVGRLMSYKHVDWLIFSVKEILKKYSDVELHVIGRGPEMQNLKILTKKLKIDSNVYFHGYIDNEGVLIKHIKSSDVFVLPSTREGWGIVLLEAMAAGTPVIAIKQKGSGVLDVVKDGFNGLLVEPNNIPQLTHAIIKLFEDKRLREKVIKNGLDFAFKHSWKEMSKRVKKVYLEVLESKK